MKRWLLALALTVLPLTVHAADMPTAPALRAMDLAGHLADLDSLRTRGPVVVTFWATWCKPCSKELPALDAVIRAHGDSVALLAVNEDGPRGRARLLSVWRSLGVAGRVIPDDDGALAERFRVVAFPTTFVIDTQGRVVLAHQGYRSGDERRVADALRRASEPATAATP